MNSPLHFRAARRSLLRMKGLALVAVVAVGFGVGATLSASIVIQGLLYRVLPFNDPSRLVFVWQCAADGKIGYDTLAYFDHWRQQRDVFSSVAAMKDASNDINFDLTGDMLTERVSGAKVSENYFEVLGVAPSLGALESRDRDSKDVVLSNGLWRRAFASDPMIVGRRVSLGGETYTATAVTRPDFLFPYDPRLWPNREVKNIDIWVRLDMPPAGDGRWRESAYRVIGRLERGMTIERAQSVLTARWRGAGLSNASTSSRVCLLPLDHELTKGFAPTLWLLLVASLVVVAMSVGDLVAILLARSIRADRENATFAALGAGASQLALKHAYEALLVTIPSAIVGVAIAEGIVGVVRPMLSGVAAGANALRVDLASAALALLLMIVVGAAVGILGSRFRSSSSLAVRLSESQTVSGGRGSRRLWSSLLVAQLSLAIVMATLAIQAVVSLRVAQATPLGFTPDRVFGFRITPSIRYGDRDSKLELLKRLRSELLATPGVERVSMGDTIPLRARGGLLKFRFSSIPDDTVHEVVRRAVDPQYFGLLAVGIAKGRNFSDSDQLGAERVAIINQAFARRYPDAPVVGTRLDFFDGEPLTVIGIAEDAREVSVASAAEPTVYFALAQAAPDSDKEKMRLPGTITFLLTVASNPREILSSVRRVVAAVDPLLPVQDFFSLEHDILAATVDQRLASDVLSFLALAALALAISGVYGILSYTIAKRSRELAIRVALGATKRSVQRGLLNDAAKSVGLAMVIALPLAKLAGGFLSWRLFDATSISALIMLEATSLVALGCLVATWRSFRALSDQDLALLLRTDER